MYSPETWRGEFISNLISDLGFSSYLELGVAAGKCWNKVICEEKIGVDLFNDSMWHIENVLSVSTDEYFSSLKDSSKKFDLVFIDAKHEKNQVLMDFSNCLKNLKKNGIVIFHDVYPFSEEDTSIENACGNVYEFWINLVDLYPDNTLVFIGNPGDIEGTVGIYFHTGNNLDKNNFSSMNYGYTYFKDNVNNYILNKKTEYTDIVNLYKSTNL